MKYVFTDEELLLVVTKQPLPITAGRLVKVMNGRLKKSSSYRRLKKLADNNYLLSRRWHYTRKSGAITIYGNGTQFRKIDEIYRREGGLEGVAKYENEWF